MYNRLMLPTRHTYETLGFKTLPVSYGRKASPPLEWDHTDSDTLWRQAPAKSNMALQAGVSGMFLLDPDTQDGQTNVASYLNGLGVHTWKITTWRGFTHHWVRTDMPEGTQWNGKLKDNMGDWRGKHGYGLAAPSFINTPNGSGYYQLPQTNPKVVPFMEWKDIVPLLKVRNKTMVDTSVLSLPVPVIQRVIPHWVYRAASIIANSYELENINVGNKIWDSRSEAVMSMLMSSLLRGYTFKHVMKWCGNYKTYQWWTASTAKAVQYVAQEGDRPVLETLYNSTYDVPKKDEDVLRAMISVLWYVGDAEGCVSNRDIQMLVARGRQSVSSSVSRLLKTDYLELIEPSSGKKASKYRVNLSTNVETRQATIKDKLHPEALRHGGLTHNQTTILDVLEENKSANQVSTETGIPLSVVYYSLKKLKRYGLVNKTGKRWFKENVSVERINNTLDVLDKGLIRKHRIHSERRAFLPK
jgi:hypothetical protein